MYYSNNGKRLVKGSNYCFVIVLSGARDKRIKARDTHEKDFAFFGEKGRVTYIARSVNIIN